MLGFLQAINQLSSTALVGEVLTVPDFTNTILWGDSNNDPAYTGNANGAQDSIGLRLAGAGTCKNNAVSGYKTTDFLSNIAHQAHSTSSKAITMWWNNPVSAAVPTCALIALGTNDVNQTTAFPSEGDFFVGFRSMLFSMALWSALDV